MALSLCLLVVGLVFLLYGSDFLVKASCSVADRLAIPPIIVGLTIVAFGTSAPELFVSTNAAIHGTADFAIGNIVGSNIFNILVIIAFAALFSRVSLGKQIVWREMPIMLFAVALFCFCAYDLKITRLEGGILFSLILLYLFSIYLKSKKGDVNLTDEDLVESSWSLFKSTVVGFFSLIAMVFGAELIVDKGVLIASSLGVSDFLVSVTLVAIGTSLPELATTYAAARRGHPDLAIGNAVGSNIFNVFSVIGVTALIQPLSVSADILDFDFPFMFSACVLIWLLMIWRKSFSRPEAILMLAIYFAYLFF